MPSVPLLHINLLPNIALLFFQMPLQLGWSCMTVSRLRQVVLKDRQAEEGSSGSEVLVDVRGHSWGSDSGQKLSAGGSIRRNERINGRIDVEESLPRDAVGRGVVFWERSTLGI